MDALKAEGIGYWVRTNLTQDEVDEFYRDHCSHCGGHAGLYVSEGGCPADDARIARCASRQERDHWDAIDRRDERRMHRVQVTAPPQATGRLVCQNGNLWEDAVRHSRDQKRLYRTRRRTLAAVL